MFFTALIALNLTQAEAPIVECIPGLLDWGVQRVVLTHIIPVGYMQGTALTYEQDYADALEALAKPLRDAGLEVTVSTRASGNVASAILEAAEEYQADLIVIGSRGQNLITKIFLGSVAREVIRKTTLPLLLEWVESTADRTKQKCETVCKNKLRHVLLATDFSRRASAAEDAAVFLARRAEQIECVYVEEADDGAATPILSTVVETALTALLQRIEAEGTHGISVLLQGKASREIARYARERDVSLIVVGKRGQNSIASLLMGSTASTLCEIAGRPVLVTP